MATEMYKLSVSVVIDGEGLEGRNAVSFDKIKYIFQQANRRGWDAELLSNFFETIDMIEGVKNLRLQVDTDIKFLGDEDSEEYEEGDIESDYDPVFSKKINDWIDGGEEIADED